MEKIDRFDCIKSVVGSGRVDRTICGPVLNICEFKEELIIIKHVLSRYI